MSIFDAILNLTRRKDPAEVMKEQILAQEHATPPVPAAPVPPDVPPQPVPPQDPNTPAPPPQQPPVANAYQSPPDMAALYEELMNRDRHATSLDQGATLIAAGLARDENRNRIMTTYPDDPSGQDSGLLGKLFDMQKHQQELLIKNQMRLALPNIAKQYGLSMEAVTLMFENGTLEEFLNTSSQPNIQMITMPDGSQRAVDVRKALSEGQKVGTTTSPNTPAPTEKVGGLLDVMPAADATSPSSITPDVSNQPVIPGTTTPIIPPTDAPALPGVEVAPAKPPEPEMIDDGRGGRMQAWKTPKGYVDAEGNVIKSLRPDRKYTLIEDPEGTGGKISSYESPEGLRRADNDQLITDVKPVPKQVRIESMADGRKQAYGEDGLPIGEPTGPATPLTTDDITEYQMAVKEGYKGDLESWILMGKEAGATKIDFGDGKLEEEIAKGTAGQYAKEYESSAGAADTIRSLTEARGQLEKGIVAGSIFSPLELTGRKAIASVFGMPDEATTNTEVFQASLKEVVLGKIKALGSGSAISNSDREYVAAAVGGDIQLNEKSIARILDILEKSSRSKITAYNNEVEKLIKSYPADKQEAMRRMIRKVEMPAAKKLTKEEALKKYPPRK